jgi:nucleoid-associated protein YgaU
MKNAPLFAATGLAVALAGAVAAITRDQWLPAPKIETAAVAVEEAKPAEAVKPAEAPKAADAAAPAAEVAAVEPPKPSEAKPAFDTVRVEASGEAIIAGSAAPGSDVAVKLDGETVGTTTANAEGAFVVIPEKALPAGTGALSIEQKKADGQTVTSEQTVAVAIAEPAKPAEPLVALVEPEAPVKVIQAPAPATPDQLTLDSIDYNDAGDIIFKGKTSANAPVRLYVNNAPLGDARADGDGAWAFAGRSDVAPGNHTLRVDQLNDQGAVAHRLELPFTREAPEKIVAAAPETETPTAAPPAAEPETAVAAAPAAERTGTIAAAAKPKNGRIVIQPGNNLWKLSQVIYGKGTQYTVIYKANKASIRDPEMIFPGQIFAVPDADPPELIDPARNAPLTADEGGKGQQ